MHGNREHSGHANTGTGTGHGQGRKGLVKQRRQREEGHDELDPNLEEEHLVLPGKILVIEVFIPVEKSMKGRALCSSTHQRRLD